MSQSDSSNRTSSVPQIENRVAAAYSKFEENLRNKVQALECDWGAEVTIVVYKHEKRMEIFLQQRSGKFCLFDTIDICAASGSPGRKIRQGDKQVPEGFYHVGVLNPKSTYHLSLGLNFPNNADQLIVDPHEPGGEIYIHGGCTSSGCCAITDEAIEWLYVLCDAAKKASKPPANVMILPCRFGETTLSWQDMEFENWSTFWAGIQEGWLWFMNQKTWPKMEVDSKGNYLLISEVN
jgi:murein L,D-transpeptidase YafK